MTTTVIKRLQFEIIKADDEKQLVFGRAIVCTKKGKPYFDKQGDHVPDETMLDAALDFAKGARGINVMHKGKVVAQATFLMPMTAELAKHFGLATEWTGLMLGVQVPADVYARVKKGELGSFSIEGARGEDEVVEPDPDDDGAEAA